MIASSHLPFPPIYLITDGGALRQQQLLVTKIEEALDGADGAVSFVQIREQISGQTGKESIAPASDEELVKLASQLKPICVRRNARLIISRRPDLVRKTGADGVHLGRMSMPVEEARRMIGSEALIGYSAHSIEEALEVTQTSSVSYLFLSPIFKPLSKPTSLTPLGVGPLEELAEKTDIPVFALGGITAFNAAECRTAGASGVAVITSILGSSDPEASAKAIARGWEGVKT